MIETLFEKLTTTDNASSNKLKNITNTTSMISNVIFIKSVIILFWISVLIHQICLFFFCKFLSYLLWKDQLHSRAKYNKDTLLCLISRSRCRNLFWILSWQGRGWREDKSVPLEPSVLTHKLREPSMKYKNLTSNLNGYHM